MIVTYAHTNFIQLYVADVKEAVFPSGAVDRRTRFFRALRIQLKTCMSDSCPKATVLQL